MWLRPRAESREGKNSTRHKLPNDRHSVPRRHAVVRGAVSGGYIKAYTLAEVRYQAADRKRSRGAGDWLQTTNQRVAKQFGVSQVHDKPGESHTLSSPYTI
jgi:hypothetical protein